MRRIIKHPDLPIITPPIDLLRELLEDKGLTDQDLRSELSTEQFENLMGPDPRFSGETSRTLSAFLGTTPTFWAELDSNFQSGKANGKAVVSKADAEAEQRRLTTASGKILFRMPRSTHQEVTEVAEAEGVSVNQLLLSYVSYGLARSANARERRQTSH